MAKKGSGQNFETDPDCLLKIELETINGKPYFGTVTDDELVYIWVKVFNRKYEELFGVTSTKTLTRNVRATFKLKSPIRAEVQAAIDGPNFTYEKFPDDGQSEVITGRILGFGSQKPAEIGELIKVSVKTNFGVEAAGVLNWLKLYGTISSSDHNFANVNNTTLRSDLFVAEIVLKKHIEEYLPMYGQKVQVNYPGIPRMCNRCYVAGHLRRECNNPKREWLAYVSELVESGINTELIGSWKSAIKRWQDANQPQDKRGNTPFSTPSK